MEKNWNERVFCRVYLETMDPEQAAAATGQGDGLALLGRKSIQKRMERMRGAAAGQLRREDVLRHLARIAFGRVNDAVELHTGVSTLEICRIRTSIHRIFTYITPWSWRCGQRQQIRHRWICPHCQS